jgi:DNA-binding response OmpR family regulator
MKTKVLLIDDDPELIEMYRIELENRGYSVIYAFSGEEGLKRALSEQPDAIVLDVMLETKFMGFNVARELRNFWQTADTPIIIMTSINAREAFQFKPDQTWLPVDVFLEKPIHPDRLSEEIDKTVNIKRQKKTFAFN